jgi:hypothetical protein
MDAEIERSGVWSGEARRLRDALGARKLGSRLSARIVRTLGQAGFEPDNDAIRYESETLLVYRAGAQALIAEIRALLPEIRDADRQIATDLPWRDELVATLAVRKWRPRQVPPQKEKPTRS